MNHQTVIKVVVVAFCAVLAQNCKNGGKMGNLPKGESHHGETGNNESHELKPSPLAEETMHSAPTDKADLGLKGMELKCESNSPKFVVFDPTTLKLLYCEQGVYQPIPSKERLSRHLPHVTKNAPDHQNLQPEEAGSPEEGDANRNKGSFVCTRSPDNNQSFRCMQSRFNQQ